MHIGIIGAGNIGSNLARGFVQAGHVVHIANSRGPQTLVEVANSTGATATTALDAVRNAELVVITIPQKNIPDLPADLLAGLGPDVAVVDTGNYYPQQRDGRIDEIENGMTESRWVANQLGRDVVKAFNGIAAKHLVSHSRPAGDPERIALPIAGDNPEAKAKVATAIDALGFDVVDAGGLDESWRQQPGTPSYGANSNIEGLTKLLADASQERSAEWRA